MRKPTKHRQAWTDRDDKLLWRIHGLRPIQEIACELGRTIAATRQRLTYLSCASPTQADGLMTVDAVAAAFGICKQAARNLMVGRRWTMTVYRRNQPVLVGVRRELITWLKNPLNWSLLAEEKIVDPELREVVDTAVSGDADRWLTLRQAADYAAYSEWGIGKAVRTGRLAHSYGSKGRKGNPLILIKKSTLDQFVANGGNWKRYE